MFAPKHFELVSRYLDGIDEAVTSRMIRKFPPDETALTGNLCALMDAETQRREGDLAFNIDALNEALNEDGDGLDFEVQIDTHPHSSIYENRVSQADFGLILEYRNRVLPEHNWSVAYLVQAKRLYPQPDNSYDMTSRFLSKDRNQHARIQALADILGPQALRYGLYTPPLSLLDASVRTVGRALHAAALNREIYDYAGGLALHEWLAQAHGRADPGIWLSDCDWLPTSLRGLHDRAWRGAMPFTWFFLDHFSEGRRRLSRHSSTDFDDRPIDGGWVRGIVSGDREAIDKLLGELDSGGEAPTGRVLPAHTVTVGLTVGANLSEDDKALRRDDPEGL
jgi:hypothetical protein